jgi:hypothetical protein
MVPVPLEKFVVAHLFKNFTTTYRTQMLIIGRREAQDAGESRPCYLLIFF